MDARSQTLGMLLSVAIHAAALVAAMRAPFLSPVMADTDTIIRVHLAPPPHSEPAAPMPETPPAEAAPVTEEPLSDSAPVTEAPAPQELPTPDAVVAKPAPPAPTQKPRRTAAVTPVYRPGVANRPPVLFVKTDAPAASRASYNAQLAAHIEQYKHYPRQARLQALEGEGEITFSLNQQGGLESLHITRSTGHSLLDSAMEATLKRAEPLPPPPPGMERFHLPLRFQLR